MRRHELGIAFNAEAAVDTALASVLDQERDAMRGSPHHPQPRGKPRAGWPVTARHPACSSRLMASTPDNLFQPCRLIALARSGAIEFAPSSRLKTLSYIDGIAAAREAVAADADDALMLNTGGHVASSTIANIFLLKGNELVTPVASTRAFCPASRGGAVAGQCPAAGFTPVEKPLSRWRIYSRADAVFLRNSLRFIRPVTTLNGEPLGQGPLDEL